MFRDCDLKLGCGPVLNMKKWRRISKRRICLVLKRSVDKVNLFVLEVELITFLRGAFVCLETLQTKIDFSFLI